MLNRTNIAFLLVATVILIGYQTVRAAPLVEGESNGQDYIVQADDWLSKLADKFYGDPLAYLAIVEATNAKAISDTAYTPIDNPDVIEIGQRLFVPNSLEAVAEIVAALEEQPVAVATTEETAPEPVVVAEEADVVTNDNDNPPPTAEQLELLTSLEVKGIPPELNNEVWLNADPMKLADLRGQVVIVEFWTYG